MRFMKTIKKKSIKRLISVMILILVCTTFAFITHAKDDKDDKYKDIKDKLKTVDIDKMLKYNEKIKKSGDVIIDIDESLVYYDKNEE